MNHSSNYKGFEVEGLKVVNGFNGWNFQIRLFDSGKFWYFSKRIETCENKIKPASREVYEYIDSLNSVPMVWNGKHKRDWLK